MDLKNVLFVFTFVFISLNYTNGAEDQKIESSLKKIIDKEDSQASEPVSSNEGYKDQDIDIFDLLSEASDEDDVAKRTLFRYGKRGALMRYGKRGALMRYGKRGGLLRYGKRGALFRYGKRPAGGQLSLEEPSGKRLFRWGKRNVDENTAKRLFRWGKRDDADLEEDKRTLFRYGKRDDYGSSEEDSLVDDLENAKDKRRIMRYGRDTRASKPHVPFRFGREE